jgi:CRP/FNR family cyclic AMP-dependent transcriptional regulator
MVSAELLKRSELFAGLSADQIERVAALGKEVEHQSDEVVVREGDASDEIYVVREGMVEVLVSEGAIPDVPGPPQMRSIVHLGPGQTFGEMALVDRGARSATIRCVKDDTRLTVLPREGLLALCDSDPRIGYLLMRNVASDLSFKLRHRNLRVRLEGKGRAP